MKIMFTPQLRADALSLSLDGDVLTVNGTAYDFGPLAEGGTLPREAVGCPLLASDVTRVGGHIMLALILPHGSDAPEAARFPQPITVTQTGPIPLPVTYAEEAPE
ncbi:hypothetical protein [Paracoccus marcusii]|uniref:Phage protein n=1 Tax=Paracoccus marcusii TaxID=59779 RepID=A0ABY7UP18_9RHOB|nr:hypothetical protein [Paracoccus marcusii]WDA11676.1 hypothetical protein PRL19_10240 [Paracoccus marcusii]